MGIVSNRDIINRCIFVCGMDTGSVLIMSAGLSCIGHFVLEFLSADNGSLLVI